MSEGHEIGRNCLTNLGGNGSLNRDRNETGLWLETWCVYEWDLSKLQKNDDVIQWKCFLRYWPFVWEIHRSPVNSPHKGQWRGALIFSFICAGIKGWVNNRAVGDLRRHRPHYDVTLMNVWQDPLPTLSLFAAKIKEKSRKDSFKKCKRKYGSNVTWLCKGLNGITSKHYRDWVHKSDRNVATEIHPSICGFPEIVGAIWFIFVRKIQMITLRSTAASLCRHYRYVLPCSLYNISVFGNLCYLGTCVYFVWHIRWNLWYDIVLSWYRVINTQSSDQFNANHNYRTSLR